MALHGRATFLPPGGGVARPTNATTPRGTAMLYSQKHPVWEYLPAGKRGEGFRGAGEQPFQRAADPRPNVHRMDKPGG